ncbi:MAG: Pvc16 family protein [Acidobacteriota bacterium]|nr:Pvc16 family protein [Acidobacteriota bacterium]
MLRDLSETLQAILDDEGIGKDFPELLAARVAFDRPSEQFNPSQPTISLFLFDIRENTELRTNERVIERRNGEALVGRPPKRIDCSYLVTAWGAGATGSQHLLEEHELLGQALQVLSRHATIPENFLQGSLKNQGLPVPLSVSGANVGGMKEPADFWSALGNKLRPSLVVTATVELPASEPVAAPFVKTQELRFGLRAPDAATGILKNAAEDLFRVGGIVTDAAGKALAGATIDGGDAVTSATTDEEGRYLLGMMPRGTYSLNVRAGKQSKSFKIDVPAPQGKSYDLQLTG